MVYAEISKICLVDRNIILQTYVFRDKTNILFNSFWSALDID